MTPSARPLLAVALALGAAIGTVPHAHAEEALAGPQSMQVVKSPTCGCCAAWTGMAREHGFAVEAVDVADVSAAKEAAGVPEALWSCHTAEIDGYVIEGHVPFAVIDRLLAERPDVAGLAVLGMPMGSPGMGDDPDARYDVIAFGGEAGAGEVFERVGR